MVKHIFIILIVLLSACSKQEQAKKSYDGSFELHSSEFRFTQDNKILLTQNITMNVHKDNTIKVLGRNFPLNYKKKDSVMQLKYKVLRATMDNRTIPFSYQDWKKQRFILLSDLKTYIPKGKHQFLIQTEMSNYNMEQKKYNEFSWTVIDAQSNPIGLAEAIIHVPAHVHQDLFRYRGWVESKGKEKLTYAHHKGRQIVFRTKNLRPGEKLKMWVRWPKSKTKTKASKKK